MRRGVSVRLKMSEPGLITLRLYRGPRRIARRTYEVESGRVRLRLRRPLPPGRYRLRLTLTDEPRFVAYEPDVRASMLDAQANLARVQELLHTDAAEEHSTPLKPERAE